MNRKYDLLKNDEDEWSDCDLTEQELNEDVTIHRVVLENYDSSGLSESDKLNFTDGKQLFKKREIKQEQ